MLQKILDMIQKLAFLSILMQRNFSIVPRTQRTYQQHLNSGAGKSRLIFPSAATISFDHPKRPVKVVPLMKIACWGTRLDRDLSERTFAFGQATAEYDEIQNLSLRTDPAVGLGYRFVNREKLMIAGRSGPGFMYQRFFGGDTDNYFTILFGGDLEAQMPYGSKVTLKGEYLPKVVDWKDSYLLRSYADWTLPISGWLDFKIALLNIYYSNPPDDTERNTFTMTAGLSLRF